MEIIITVEIEDGDANADPNDSTGLTEAAYVRLTESGPLGWLGEVTDVAVKR